MEASYTYCMLLRDFEAGENRVTLGLKPYEGGKTFDLIFVTPVIDSKSSSGTAKIVFDDGKESATAPFSTSANSERAQSITLMRPSVDLNERILHGGNVRIEFGSTKLIIQTPASEKARAVLSKCQTDLMTTWKNKTSPGSPEEKTLLGAAAGKAARLQPGHLTRLFGNPENYPADAIRARMEGVVEAMLVISQTGKIDQCAIVSSPAKSLSDQTCELMRPVPFIPAQAADGKPIASKFLLRVGWRLPGGA